MNNIVDPSQGRIGTGVQNTDLHGHRKPFMYAAFVVFSCSAHDEEETSKQQKKRRAVHVP